MEERDRERSAMTSGNDKQPTRKSGGVRGEETRQWCRQLVSAVSLFFPIAIAGKVHLFTEEYLASLLGHYFSKEK